MIFRRIVLTLCFLALPAVAHADISGPAQKIPKGGVLRGDFVEDHYYSNDKKPIRSEGSFIVAEGKGILWMFQKPVPINFIVTRDSMTQAFGNIPIVQTPASKFPVIARIPDMIIGVLAGNWDMLEKDFAITRSVKPDGWSATLKPLEKTKGMPFQSLTANGAEFVENARVMRKNGGLDKFTFSNQKISTEALSAAEAQAFEIATISGR